VGAVVGDADDDVVDRLPVERLVTRYGIERAMAEPMWCIEDAARALIVAMTT